MSKTTSLAVIEQPELFDGLEDITAADKATLERETRALRDAMVNFGRSKLAIGEHLSKIQLVLKEDRRFLRFIRNLGSFSQRSAYRYIQGYEQAKTLLPANVLEAAMARGMNMIGNEENPLGTYTDAIKELPPPKTSDHAKVQKYLDSVKEVRAQLRSDRDQATKPEELLREAFRAVDSRFQMLPNNHKTRQRFIERLAGMLITLQGVSSAQRFAPDAIPDGWKVVRGRPRKKEAA